MSENPGESSRQRRSEARGGPIPPSREQPRSGVRATTLLGLAAIVAAILAVSPGCGSVPAPRAEDLPTATKIKHLIVVVDENEAFTRMFATYPWAANPADEASPRFYGKVGNKAPRNYLELDASGLPVNAGGQPIRQFSPTTPRPVFNSWLTKNPNAINPYRLNAGTFICYNSHEYDSELWSYGIWQGGSHDAPGDMQADQFVRYGGGGYGGSIVGNHFTLPAHLAQTDSPYYRTRFGWACLGPANDRRNVSNGAGDPGSAASVSPNLELMQGQDMLAGTNFAPSVTYDPEGRSFYTERFGDVMGYWDGNAVQALWRYAQAGTLSDNFHQLTYGPSTLGHLYLTFGTTGPLSAPQAADGALAKALAERLVTRDAMGQYFMSENLMPALDDCSEAVLEDIPGETRSPLRVIVNAANLGDRLNAGGVSWGWFNAGFRSASGSANCKGSGLSQFGTSAPEYSAGTEPFQYSKTTSNPRHVPPLPGEVGHAGPANHQYDLSDFAQALQDDLLPAVSFLKPKTYQSGHGDFSGPTDEQLWLVNVMNLIQTSGVYARGDTAVIITQDDSDGTYDPVLLAPEQTWNGGTMIGPGPRLSFVLVAPWARRNFVDSVHTDQSSVARFIKYNWGLGDAPMNPYSTEETSGSLLSMFDFDQPVETKPVLLYCDGSPYDGSTGTPPPMLGTFSGPVTTTPDNDIVAYLSAAVPPGSHGLVPPNRNRPIRKEGFETRDGHYECANQFGY